MDPVIQQYIIDFVFVTAISEEKHVAFLHKNYNGFRII